MKESCYQLLSSFHRHLKWCKVWYVKEEGPGEVFVSLKLRYLRLLAERIRWPTETYEAEKLQLLTILSELFIYRLNTVPCFALLNLYAGAEKKFLSTRKLGRLEKSGRATEEERALVNLLVVARNLSSDLYQRAILSLKDVIVSVESGHVFSVNLQLLYLFLGAAYFQRSFCRTRNDSEKANDIAKGQMAMQNYYDVRVKSHALEANYNMGRTYHCIGNLTKAAKHYSDVLTLGVGRKLLGGKDGVKVGEETGEYEAKAAYNLAAIYQRNGNVLSAQRLLINYIKF